MGTAAVGQRMSTAMFVDGDDEARLLSSCSAWRRGVLRDGRPEVSHVPPLAVRRQDDPRAHGRGVRPGRRGCSSGGPPAHGRCRQWPRNRHRAAGARPPGGWPGCWRRDRLRRAPGGPRPARDRGGVRYGGRAPGGRPEAGRSCRRIGHPWRTVGPCAPAGWRGVRYVHRPRARVLRARVGGRGRRLVARLRLHAVDGRDASQPHVARPEGGADPPARLSKTGRHTVRREARVLVPAAEDRTIHPRTEDRSIDA